jgi:branched-chain amino acid transport system ATP-binding protein
VRDNLVIGGHTLSSSELSAGIHRAIELFPVLGERLQQPAGSLSGGEQQMLAIGRALMTRPRILLLDEPSLGLAPLVTQQVFEIIQETHRRGTTVVLVEQNARMALRIADSAYVLANGRIETAGSARELAAAGEIERSYLGGQNR